jgi:hypothetical protein
MRRNIIASLLLSPVLFTAAAIASPPVNAASASTQVRPLSTGVTAPQIIHSTDIALSPRAAETIPYNAEVVVNVKVDSTVRQFRWRPATLDNQAIPMDLTLNVVVQH